MRTRMVSIGFLAAGMVLGVLALRQEPVRGDAFGLKGRYEVARLELGYRLEDKGMRVRAQLSGSDVVEYETRDPEMVDRLLDLAQIKGSGGRIGVEVEGNELKAFYVVAGGAFHLAGR